MIGQEGSPPPSLFLDSTGFDCRIDTAASRKFLQFRKTEFQDPADFIEAFSHRLEHHVHCHSLLLPCIVIGDGSEGTITNTHFSGQLTFGYRSQPMISANCLNIRLSALVENLGPSMHRYAPPIWYGIPMTFAVLSNTAFICGQNGSGMAI